MDTPTRKTQGPLESLPTPAPPWPPAGHEFNWHLPSRLGELRTALTTPRIPRADQDALLVILAGWSSQSRESVDALRSLCARRARFHCGLRRISTAHDIEDVEQTCLQRGLELLGSERELTPEELFDEVDLVANSRSAQMYRWRRRRGMLREASGGAMVVEADAVELHEAQERLVEILHETLRELRIRHPNYAEDWARYFASPPAGAWPGKRPTEAMRDVLLDVLDRHAGRLPRPERGPDLASSLARYLRGQTPKSPYAGNLRALLEYLASAPRESP